jgi:hypothetical protein
MRKVYNLLSPKIIQQFYIWTGFINIPKKIAEFFLGVVLIIVQKFTRILVKYEMTAFKYILHTQETYTKF